MASSQKNSTNSADANMEKNVALLTKQDENLKVINKRLDKMEKKIDGVNVEILDQIKGLNKRVVEVEKSAEFFAKQYESKKKISENLLKSHTSLSDENKELKIEINHLRSEQERQKSTLNDLEQYGRRECIEVSGVPVTENEDTKEIIMTIAKEIGVQLGRNDISACHRVKKSKGDPIIIAKFVNRKMKDVFMAQQRNLKQKTLGTLKLTTDEAKKNGKVFVNESLTPMNRNLFRLTRMKCEEKGWKFSWTRNGVVFARMNKQSLIVKIGNLKELDQKVVSHV